MFKNQQIPLENATATEKKPEAATKPQNVSIELSNKLEANVEVKTMTSEQFIDTLVKQGSVVAKTIKEKIDEGKKMG